MTTQAYIDAFKQAQLDVIARIDAKTSAGSVAEYEQELFAEIDNILQGLGVDTRKWLEQAVPAAYKHAANVAYRQLSMTPTASASFVGVNQAPVRVIVTEAHNDMRTSLMRVGRNIDDQIRQAGIKAAQKKLTTNQTLRAMKKELKQDFLEQGYVMGVEDSRGRMMNLDAYAETFTRSITREATNTGTMDTAHSLSCHLFKMSKHFPTCGICAPRQDRVYRDIDFPAGDERNQFPHIRMAFPGWPQYANVHPRCRHVMVAIGWDGLSRETQLKYLADAKKPFNTDPRGEKEIKAYDLGQADYRMMRNDRKQWERMRARLGDDAPKSFAAFRRIKYADGGKNRAFYDEDGLHAGEAGNGKRWVELQAEYRQKGIELKREENGDERQTVVSV